MFTPVTRLVLVLFCFISAGFLLYRSSDGWIIFFVAGIILIYEHFRGGSIWAAFQAYRKNNLHRVRKILDGINNPERLKPSAKAYYHFLRGVIFASDDDFNEAQEQFLLAAEGPLRTDNMKCAVFVNLSSVSLELGHFDEAKEYFEQANATPHRPEMNQVLEDLGKKIKKESLR